MLNQNWSCNRWNMMPRGRLKCTFWWCNCSVTAAPAPARSTKRKEVSRRHQLHCSRYCVVFVKYDQEIRTITLLIIAAVIIWSEGHCMTCLAIWFRIAYGRCAGMQLLQFFIGHPTELAKAEQMGDFYRFTWINSYVLTSLLSRMWFESVIKGSSMSLLKC